MQWYYVEGEDRVGPLSDEEFQALVETGKIKSRTLVWHEGMSDWQVYDKIRDRSSRVAAKTVGVTGTPGASVCSECGKAFSEEEMIRYGETWICAACKPIFVQKLKEGVSVAGAMEYAGFWIRFGAKIIDGIILWVISMVIYIPAGFMMVTSSSDPSRLIILQIILYFIQIAIGAAYTTWFLGRYGATLGKMACKIMVVTPDGGRVSYARALGRHFAEWISAMILCIGYIMVAFDDEKRALHDRICNTRVVRK